MAADSDGPPMIRRGKGLRLSPQTPDGAAPAETPAPTAESAQPAIRRKGLRLSTQVREGASLVPPRSAPPASAQRRIATPHGAFSYLVAGTGPPLIMLHGWGASAQLWGDTLTTLADLRTIYACDLPGFGASPARAAVPTLATLADEVLAFADAMGLTRFDLLGHALGAAVAACVAGRHQGRVGSLIVTSLGARIFAPALTALDLSRPPFDLTMGLARPLFDLWQPLNRVMMQSQPVALTLEALLLHDGPRNSELWRGYLADHAAADTRAYVTALTAVGDPALHAALRAISAPTLCIAGREDHIAHLAESTVAHTLIAGSRLHILDHCGHMPMLEQPEAFHHTVREFLTA